MKQEQAKNDTELKLDKIREAVESKLKTLQDDNERRFDKLIKTNEDKQNDFKVQFSNLSAESKDAITILLKSNEEKNRKISSTV
ncbi:MAG: hypothetical protein IPK46_00145 [Saprospiraceae bacterium]|nr:hypothetical protein [Saprospiraceae bacterium]